MLIVTPRKPMFTEVQILVTYSPIWSYLNNKMLSFVNHTEYEGGHIAEKNK